ncbi:MAG: tRNA (guanosine(46)-N7)-methyltransferase TrmB [Pseudomonadales bacterium]|nr:MULTISPECIES: tRNA (guanosine(46)-N7)-methyltransferase TrmB [unclassified Ketobacter]MAQ26837.1 tRNA (guanosine(46)-N7)-methyltransferase TrmB [Pseudomonadales bacterium]MCK5792615.1 tRNA (guanosine(46)-N7)-methyltransferase TrmB [Ketobacter sp.]MEC8810166.1 tRNA (guanosine(46)-N7)-methyltransferase TrmB [Pseudomonadota bacterium]RLT90906.1 MAG: tRNA (guanosine(46)-N7)-methyltransferase TrmB [Ketobacter sp. GenoA1]TNC89988.1 MAG: tRNA (guanosine(46)-N7)-methyltransferase TrmB [Alcanivorax 
MNEMDQPQRRLRSFVRRQGRMTEGQSRAMETLWQDYGLDLRQGLLNSTELFGNDGPVILEIGFGDGVSLLQMAQAAADSNFIGIEVHRPGVGKLINDAHHAGVTNIRVFCEDAIDVLQQCIADNSLDGVQLFFPDPWHKKRHNKRRIVQAEFAQLVRTKLKVGGYFHMATDWEPYAEHMLAVMSAADGYENQAGAGQYSPKPDYRPVTKFERRGERLGHGVWDLVFIKSS